MTTADLHPVSPHARARHWRGAGGWILSSGTHVLIALLVAMVLTISRQPQEVDPLPGVATKLLLPAQPPKPPTERSLSVAQVLPVLTDHEPDDPVMIAEVNPLQSVVEPTEVAEQVAATPSEALSSPADQATGASAMFAAIGTAGGGSTPAGFGTRGKPHGPGQGHGPTRAEFSATQAALRWFVRHQSADGHWDVDQYQNQCQDGGAKCEPGTAHTGSEGDIACTSLALLCFLGYGHDGVNPTMYRAVVAKGLQWLVEQQGSDGVFGVRNYEHAVAVMALADAMALGGGRLERVRQPLNKAVAVILARQNPGPDASTPSGWDYLKPNAKRDDTSVTGWNIMALKSAHLAGVDIGRGFAGGRAWLTRAWRAANPNYAQLSAQSTSVFPYNFNQQTGTTERDHLVGVAATCAAFLGHQRGEVMLESLVNQIVAKDLPAMRTWPCNVYLLYYDTMAMFQVTSDLQGRDPRWTAWYQPVSTMLIGAQRRADGCFDGSWDFADTKFAGHDTGRLLSTALCCLAIEVQERFAVATLAH